MKKTITIALFVALACSGPALAQGNLPGMSSPSIPVPAGSSGGSSGCSPTGATSGYLYNNGSSGCSTSPTLTTNGSVDTESGTLNVTGALQLGGGALAGANPSAAAGPAAINGVATTYMRSDASPAVQLGTAAQKGILQGDGATLSIVSGVIGINLSNANLWTAAQLFPAGSSTNASVAVGVANTGLYSISTTGFCFALVNGTCQGDYGISNPAQISFVGATLRTLSIQIGASSQLSWTGRGILSTPSAGVIQLGATDAASPVAQTLEAQSVAAGNTNVPGATLTIAGSKSNGSGGGDVVIQTTASSASSGSQNALVEAVRFKGGTQETIFAAPYRAKGYTVSSLPSGNQGDMAFVTDAVACTFLATPTGSGAVACPVFYNGTAWVGG